MAFYLIQFLFLSSFSLVKEKHFQKCIFYISLIFYFFLSFLRWECGTDWDSYLKIFENSFVLNPDYEKGFAYLNYIVRAITTNYTCCLFAEAVIIYLSLSYAFGKNFPKYPILVFTAFFALFRADMFFVRQNIAVDLCLCSYACLIRNHKKRAFIFWVCALFFHRSSIVFILAFIFYNRYIKRNTFVVIIFVSLLSSTIFKTVIPILWEKTGISVFYLASFYLNAGTEETFGYGGGLSSFFIILRSSANRFLFLFFLILSRKKYKSDFTFNSLFNFYFISICLFLIFAPLNLTLGRFQAYFSIYEVFLYPYLIDYHKNKYIKMLFFIVIIGWLFLRFYTALQGNYEFYIPYKIKGF